MYDLCVGKPSPSIVWYRNNEIIKNESDVVHDKILRSTIVMKNLGRQDVHSELMCNANNNNKSIALSSTVRIEMTCKYMNYFIINQNMK